MDDTAGFDEELHGGRPSPAAPGSDRRTAVRRSDAPRPDPLGATVAVKGFDPTVAGADSPSASETLDPSDPIPVTIAGDASLTAARSAGAEARRREPGAVASEPTSGPPPDPNTPTRAGDALLESSHRAAPTIPGYEIQGELGRGGMGVVYQARQVRLNRPCALKMILAGAHATPEAAARFLAEAEAIAKLEHPHIVRIHHIGEADGLPFFELEFVPGGSLDRQLDGTPWPPARAARLAAQLAFGIAEAHRLGIVHRDLKPGNILLTADGTPKITDFGLAKAAGSEAGLTRSEAILGSPSYMAPEQAGGKTKEAGPAADIYAVGALLYELLTGRPPFRGATILETLEQVKTVEPVPPSRVVPRLPRDIETICLKCLQKDPGRRYESAAVLAEDLRRFQAGETIVARPVGRPERAWRWFRRNPVVAGLTAAVLLLFAAGFAGVTWNYWRAEAARRELEGALYFQRIALAHRELSVDNLGRALELLDLCPEGLRQWEWRYLKRLCRVEPVVLHDPGKTEVNSVAFSPDGLRLAAAAGDGTVKVWDIKTGEVTRTLKADADFVYSVAFHPEGGHLASAGADRKVKVWDLTTGHEVFTRPGYDGIHYGTAYGVAFSPDGRLLAAGSEGAVNLWDWRDHRHLRSLKGHEKRAISVAFSSDGRRLASGSWGGNVMIWDAETGERLHTLSGHHQPVSALAFSPDGLRLASASFDRRLIVWDATTGRRHDAFRGHEGLVLGVAFSHDGRRLASCGEDKTVRVWDAATHQEVLGLRGHIDMSLCVAFSHDGRRLASCGRDATIRLWDAAPLRGDEGQEGLTLIRTDSEVWSTAISRDGRRIASGGLASPGLPDAPVKVWDLPTGRMSLELAGHPGVVFCVAWHPDGDRIASSGWNDERKMFVVKVWDTRTGRPAYALPAGAETYAVAFSPDRRYLVTGGANRALRVWDARTGHEVGTLGTHDREIRGLAFSPDSRHLASASADGTVKLWDATRPGEKQEGRGPIRAWAARVAVNLAFSPDGSRLVVGGAQNAVKIWGVPTGREIRTLPGHSGDVWAAAFSPDPDGRWIASAGEDSTVKIWDSQTGTLLRNLRGHTGLVTSVAFTRDGRWLVSGSRDRTVRVLDLSHLEKNPLNVQGGENGSGLRDRDTATDGITGVDQ
jgi:WD40 repeat protein